MSASFHVGDPQAPQPNRPRRLGVAVVLRDAGGRVLLECRADSAQWGLVGGGVDDGESALTAVHREVTEETGLALAELRPLGLFSDPTRILSYPDGNVLQSVTVAFVGSLRGSTPTLSEESLAFSWFEWDEIPWAQVPATQVAIRQIAHANPAGAPEFYVD